MIAIAGAILLAMFCWSAFWVLVGLVRELFRRPAIEFENRDTWEYEEEQRRIAEAQADAEKRKAFQNQLRFMLINFDERGVGYPAPRPNKSTREYLS